MIISLRFSHEFPINVFKAILDVEYRILEVAAAMVIVFGL